MKHSLTLSLTILFTSTALLGEGLAVPGATHDETSHGKECEVTAWDDHGNPQKGLANAADPSVNFHLADNATLHANGKVKSSWGLIGGIWQDREYQNEGSSARRYTLRASAPARFEGRSKGLMRLRAEVKANPAILSGGSAEASGHVRVSSGQFAGLNFQDANGAIVSNLGTGSVQVGASYEPGKPSVGVSVTPSAPTGGPQNKLATYLAPLDEHVGRFASVTLESRGELDLDVDAVALLRSPEASAKIHDVSFADTSIVAFCLPDDSILGVWQWN